MSLNIKNPETHKLVRELAELAGESMATAVAEAVRERLQRLRREKGRQSKSDRLMALIDDCAARLNGPGKMMEIDDLYDEETGLPK